MRAKDSLKLEALRAIKSEVLLAQTSSGGGALLSKDEEIKLLQRLIKQRKDSAVIYKDQNREDLVSPELDQADVISAFLPKQLSTEEIEKIVTSIILKMGAEGMKDMGKVMGILKKDYSDSIDFSKAGAILKEILNKK